MTRNKTSREVGRLVQIMATLRSPEGCPWDARQTPRTLKPYLVEEVYEVLDAIDRGEPEEICEELGDLLLQVVFQARIFEEQGKFSLADVAGSIADKLVRRHPHVFGELERKDPSAHHREWERIKAEEKAKRGRTTGILGEIPRQLPALQRAQKLIGKAARLGFSFPDRTTALGLARRKLDALEQALPEGDEQTLEEFLGDLLFSLADVARTLDIDAELALRHCSDRFITHMEGQEPAITATAPAGPEERGLEKGLQGDREKD